MLQLRITQHALAEDRHRVEIALEGDGARRTAESTFAFGLSPQDEEDLRWYLEDFLQYPQEPAPAIALRVEGRMAEVGNELFRAVFQANDDARDLWAELRKRLPQTRIEIVTGVAEAATIPWELLRDPKTGSHLALTAHSFVRAHPNPALAPSLPARKKGKIRILLVLCRPRGEKDVPFRSVASQLLRGLSEANREAYDLDVLRPPTFEQLGKALRQAHEEGKPYHVVHFDGHGMYLAGPNSGKRGYLWFENLQLKKYGKFVDGTSLGQLLAATGVSVLVLNACRSAHSEPAPTPSADATTSSQVRAFGSLAQEVIDTGVAGVVAMRYNVYVVTAAQLVAQLYASLVRGAALGEAVTLARRDLADNPLREVIHTPLPLQDWTVPVVYELAPLQIFPEVKDDGSLTIQVQAGATVSSAGSIDADLPPPPDAGFFGRDETLLALDRAFDEASIVLLHAYAGSGKTTTAAEFARWYSLTGAVDGPVLFTTFERYLPLSRVLDRIGQVFGPALENAGVHWLALEDAKRREVALQVLSQIPVLWIWDNVEPVAGFPAGTESAWKAEEQGELLGFLHALRQTKAKVLLTSRRDERSWLGDLPVRIQVPPMPITESLQLVRALAERHGRRLTDVEDWRPLLAFAQGNPLTLTVLAGQALREGLRTKEQIGAFVTRLRSGEATFSDEINEGRSRSLGASLAYGFEQAFSEEERKKLALLHLFQGIVNVGVLGLMGEPKAQWCLPEVRGLIREESIALLNRASEVGLLTAYGGGYYGIHPALPWFFKDLFDRHYPAGDLAAERAFVESMGELVFYYKEEYKEGSISVINVLLAEEANLLYACFLARVHSWWQPALRTMVGLEQLYDHTGRQAERKRLVKENVPVFVDPESGGPLPEREMGWGFVTKYLAELAEKERKWADAERLWDVLVDWSRRRATPALTRPAEELKYDERLAIQTLAVSLEGLARIHEQLRRVECVPMYEEAFKLSERIGDWAEAAICAFNLGSAFRDVPTLRDLNQAEYWYRRSLGLRAEHDRLGRVRCVGNLGILVEERFHEARIAGLPNEELLRHLNEAIKFYHEALYLTPADAVFDLAVVHSRLGNIYNNAAGVYNKEENLDLSVQHHRESIHLEEIQGDLYRTARARFSMAVALLNASRPADALEYAETALRGYESYGERAADKIEETRGLIANIRGR